MGLPLNHPQTLTTSYGGVSSAGTRSENQDAFVVREPGLQSELETKGMLACIADGVSCSEHGQKASHTSVMQFVADYYATPESWSVRRSAIQVLTSLNTWLYEQSLKQPLKHNGLVTTFSAVVVKSNTAYLFHVGDSRIYLLRQGKLRLLTRDHQRTNIGKAAYLTRALGMDSKLEVDFQTVAVETGDLFLLSTDGVHDFITEKQLVNVIQNHLQGFETRSQALTDLAIENGSQDNVTSLLVSIDHVPNLTLHEFQQQSLNQVVPPPLKVNNRIDSYTVTKVLHAGTRSHVYEVRQEQTDQKYILKAPSLLHVEDKQALLDISNEYWVGTHVNSHRIMRTYPRPANSPFLYLLCEPIEGITLRQWMLDNPTPSLDSVRSIVSEIVKAVRVLQRLDMVHRDLKPENVMISESLQVTLIDLGSVSVKGLDEARQEQCAQMPKGAANYIAPEYLNGNEATTVSDLFSVAVMTYEMLSGTLPYKAAIARSVDSARHQQWKYQSIQITNPELPLWLDMALKKACHHNPQHRHQALGEFLLDLSQPNKALMKQYETSPLIKKHPLLFWKGATALLALLAAIELMLLMIQ
ncbi:MULTISPECIES: bifunctional protein-serine/threonine kinase/phosphatase [Vibrio]|uniref:bifunctional protein-serine/threonine kinase/phosphatase n=1 Tax=Vibrio TaxID=662 RepID=UPI0004E0B829|nr:MULTISPECIES: bifunctional protein-serine/threonine kinase/phosphatase [Vibrio]MCF4172438.1 protein kinase [Vibrio sp. McD22-P3]MCG9658894.1 protein kinase [Vibrio mediterranei]MCY9851199.1 protein kinase [Vibrio mediterranei]NOH26589.1 bifunctional protein-serine/threonine kinase/phosphatase [Vibrio mediterranei]